MKYWTEYDPDTGVRANVTVGVNPKLWHWIEQTRGNKPRSQFVREILTKTMERAKRDNEKRDGKEWQKK